MAKKVTPKKAVSKKAVASKSKPQKSAKVSKPKPKVKAKVPAKKKAPAKPVAKKVLAKKPIAKPSVKKSAKKTVVKSTPKKSAKPIAKPTAKSTKKVAQKPVVKSKVQPKKTVVVAKKSNNKKALASNKKPSSSKKISREMERRAAVNAKAAPKKAVPQKVAKKTMPKVQKVEPKVKKQQVVSNREPKKSEKKSSKFVVSKKSQKEVAETQVREVETEKHVETPDIHVQSRGSKFRIRPSNNIYFSLEDLNSYLVRREVMQASPQVEKKSGKAKLSSPQVAQKRPVVAPVPRAPLAVATVFDILGITPATQSVSPEKLDEQDVPRKWKKYYKLLVDLRKHHSSGVETRAEEVMKRSAKDDAGDLSSYGQHLADAGSESFERDMAYNIISNQKEILSEIDEAIKRIKNGTYGICEVTGLPIPESRLMSIPYTRCTKEGQEIKETEIKRQKANRRTSLYDMSDGSQGTSHSDEDSASE